VTGSVAEFEEAFSDRFVAARSLALRIVGSYPLAEDVSAETLIRAFVHWKRIGRKDWRKAWVLRVATNLSLKAWRNRLEALLVSRWFDQPMWARRSRTLYSLQGLIASHWWKLSYR
jgi:DNA-directed RNA polymerase specialized sigma24 family protein